MKSTSSLTSAFVAVSVTLVAAMTACSSSSDTTPIGSSSGNGSSTSSSSGSGNTTGTASSTSSGSTSTSGINWTNYSTATCTSYEKCLTPFFKLSWPDEATCVSNFTTVFTERAALPGAPALTQAQVDACAAALTTAAQSCGTSSTIPPAPAACVFPSGTLAVGAACTIDTQCASNNCDFSSSTDAAPNCGKCAKLGEVGDACESFSDCDTTKNLTCVSQKCTAPLANGAACTNDFDAAQCGSDDACINGTCSARLQSGATCDPDQDQCADGFECDATSQKCTAIQSGPPATFVALGAACDPDSTSTYCTASYCDATTKVCTAFKNVGDACTDGDQCSPGLALDCDDTTKKCITTIDATCK